MHVGYACSLDMIESSIHTSLQHTAELRYQYIDHFLPQLNTMYQCIYFQVKINKCDAANCNIIVGADSNLSTTIHCNADIWSMNEAL